MPANAKNQAEGTTPLTWPWALRSKPVTSSEATRWKGTLLRRWRGTSAVMEQPPLDQHYIVMHLGGPKRVLRRRDGIPVSTIAECGSLTLVPAAILFAFGTKGLICKALSGGPRERPRGGSDSGRPSGLPALRFKANSIGSARCRRPVVNRTGFRGGLLA